MPQRIFSSARLLLQSELLGIIFLFNLAATAAANSSLPTETAPLPSESAPLLEPSPNSSQDPASAPPMRSQSVQLDPLNSPHPVPWNWVLANLTAAPETESAQIRYYRSQALISPDGRYSAYSRIQMQVHPDFTQNRISSVLFLENLATGDLRTIIASSPLAEQPGMTATDQPLTGTIAILIPVAWSETGDRILAREFESIFGSDIASDYAVIWDRQRNHTRTVAPTRIQYTNAVLLGWSQAHPEQALFRAGNIGEAQWPLWTVDLTGRTTAAPEDQPLVFGRFVNSIWTGPQAHL